MNAEEKAEYYSDCQIDDRMCEGFVREKCIPLTNIGEPAKCPVCAPNQWIVPE